MVNERIKKCSIKLIQIALVSNRICLKSRGDITHVNHLRHVTNLMLGGVRVSVNVDKRDRAVLSGYGLQDGIADQVVAPHGQRDAVLVEQTLKLKLENPFKFNSK